MGQKMARFHKFYIRFVIILFWVGLIFGVLFHTKLIQMDSSKTKELHVFAWSNVVTPDLAKAFEKKYGIPVKLDFYASNEELIVKLKATRGAGYDLIVPSDYAIKLMVAEGLLKPIDKSKLNFIDNINPFLMNHDHDPGNIYSLPLQWDLSGFGVDEDLLKEPEGGFTWGHLFDPSLVHYKIAMSNDPVEAFCAAAMYLFGPNKISLNAQEAKIIKQLLIDQKKWVEAYAVPRSDFFVASKNAVMALTLSGYVLKAKEDFSHIQFVVPKDSTFISIESVAIPIGSEQDDNLYKFINFLFEAENQVAPCNQYGGFPGTSAGVDLLNYKDAYERIVKIIGTEGYQLRFCRHLVSDEEMRVMWVDIKS